VSVEKDGSKDVGGPSKSDGWNATGGITTSGG
jgi:hypothetical protein